MKKKLFILPLLVALVVGASFVGCLGSGASPQSPTSTPTATPTATPTSTPGGTTPIPPPTGTPTQTPHPDKALVGFVLGFKLINITWTSTTGVTQSAPPTPYESIFLLVQPYLVFPNGTKMFLLNIWKKNFNASFDYFYIIGFNRTQGWHGADYENYQFPFWGNTTFYFSTLWNKTKFYNQVVWDLMKGGKIQLKLGITSLYGFLRGNGSSFTSLVENFTVASPPPVIVINWTPNKPFDKVLVSRWTMNKEESDLYGCKCQVYIEIWIKPVYVSWGDYPPCLLPWEIPGNDYEIE